MIPFVQSVYLAVYRAESYKKNKTLEGLEWRMHLFL